MATGAFSPAMVVVFGALATAICLVLLVQGWAADFVRIPRWYQLALQAAATAVLVGIWIGAVLIEEKIVDKETATFWAGLLVAAVSLVSFLLSRFADEMVRRETKLDAEIRLALALFAEISSNLRQQRKAFTEINVITKFEQIWSPDVPPPAARSPLKDIFLSGSPSAAAIDKTAQGVTAVDESQPFFNIAIERYSSIPASAIQEVVEYYNLDSMASQTQKALVGAAYEQLPGYKKAKFLMSYYDLLMRVDSAGLAAITALKHAMEHVSRHLDSRRTESLDGFERKLNETLEALDANPAYAFDDRRILKAVIAKRQKARAFHRQAGRSSHMPAVDPTFAPC